MSKVLLVDSDSRFIESLNAELKQYQSQFEFLIVSDGRAAMESLKEEDICLLATDIKIPKADSFALLTYVNSSYPRVPCIVMVPYEMPEFPKERRKNFNLIYLRKPFDVHQLSEAILDGLDVFDEGKNLSRLTVYDLLPLIKMEELTSLLGINTNGNEKGLLYFEKGVLYDAVCGELCGEKAALEVIYLKNAEISFNDFSKKKIRQRIKPEFMSDIMRASFFNEAACLQGKLENYATNNTTINRGEHKMTEITEILKKFQVVDGFQAVGTFSPNGEMVAEVNPAGLKIDELGALANDVLLKAQKATEIMGVGRGQMVHVEAPKAQIVARCLNEATDYTATSSGRAHVHMVVILEKECNLAMAKMKIDGVIQEIAEFFR